MEFNLLFFNLFFELIVLYDIYLKPYKLYQSILAQQPGAACGLTESWRWALCGPSSQGLHTKVKVVDVSVKKECVM